MWLVVTCCLYIYARWPLCTLRALLSDWGLPSFVFPSGVLPALLPPFLHLEVGFTWGEQTVACFFTKFLGNWLFILLMRNILSVSTSPLPVYSLPILCFWICYCLNALRCLILYHRSYYITCKAFSEEGATVNLKRVGYVLCMYNSYGIHRLLYCMLLSFFLIQQTFIGK